MFPERQVKLFRNGRNQAVRIPREFELPGEDAIMHKEGSRLIIEPAPKKSLLDLLASWEPLDEEFPVIEDLPAEPFEFLTRRLLDTNIISDFIRNPRGRAAQRIAEIGQAGVCTSIIVAAELRYGVAKKGSPTLASRVGEALDTLEVLPFDPPADEAYADMRVRLERSGRVISANDMFIAAHALSLGCILVTDNEREFGRVEGLVCENWLR